MVRKARQFTGIGGFGPSDLPDLRQELALVDDHVYILNEPGIAWCLEPKTGEKKWEERVNDGKSSCSTAHVAGRLYTTTEAGTTIVWEPSTEGWKVLAENKLDELTRASPAYSDGQIFIRTYQALYCIEEKK